MACKGFKSRFITGIDYLSHQQQHGDSGGAMQMLNRRLKFSKDLYRKDLFSHYGCVNAIEFSNDGEWMISGGDDKRVLLWNMDKTVSQTNTYQPKIMKSEHNSNIFCLAFNKSQTQILSSGNDEQVILHDINTKESLDVFLHDEAVYGISSDPLDDNMFATACDDGRILIWDIRQGTRDPFTLAVNSTAYHAVMHNPAEPRFLATANAKEGVCLWDIRVPKKIMFKYGASLISPSAMSVRFNTTGTRIIALRRRLPPVLYDVTSVQPVAEFDHPEYYNSCTMKSCCFAGDKDQYVLSGSDDFKLYVWKIPEKKSKKICINKPRFVLRGHRSIVNQVRYNNTYGIIASSGVEKIIKLWSSFPLTYSEEFSEYVSKDSDLRKVYTHEEYINLVLHSGQFMTHDYSHRSTREDPRMMAFFDSLIQRDIEGWTSDSDTAEPSKQNTTYEVQSSESDSSTLSSSTSDDEVQNITFISKWTPSQLQEKPRLPASCNLNNVVATSRLFANSQAVSSCLFSNGETTNRRLFTNSEETPNRLFTTSEAVVNRFFGGNNVRIPVSTISSNGDSSDHPAQDRISQLIAQKRRVQKLKTDRKSMKKSNKLVKKRYKLIKQHLDKTTEASNGFGFIPVNPESSNTNVDSTKDKRKFLRKKRAKLSKDSNLEGRSSDSDDNCEDKTIKNMSNGVENNQNVAGGSSEVRQGLFGSRQNFSTEGDLFHNTVTAVKLDVPPNSIFSAENGSSGSSRRLFSNSVASEKEPLPSNINENSSLQNDNFSNKISSGTLEVNNVSAETGLNGTENVDNSNSSVCFPNSVGRQKGRNYRKRSAEDDPED